MPASSSKRNRETNDVDVDARSRSRFRAMGCVFGCESESAATHVPAFLLKQISARPHLRFFRPRHFDHESSASAGFLEANVERKSRSGRASRRLQRQNASLTRWEIVADREGTVLLRNRARRQSNTIR